MRKQLLTKMLLIAATLFMGTSAWGATVNVNSTESAYVLKNSTDNYNGASNALVAYYTQYRNWGTSADGTANFRNNAAKLVLYKFSLADFKSATGSMSSATFTFTTTSTENCYNIFAVGYKENWSASTVTGANLTNNSGTITGVVTATGSFQPLGEGYAALSNGSKAKDISIDATTYIQSAMDAGLDYVSFAVGINLSRNLPLNSTAKISGEFTTAAATTYTVKYQNAGGTDLKDPAVYNTFVGEIYTASSADMASFYSVDTNKKYVYKSGNTSATATSTAASNVITLVFDEYDKIAYTVIAKNGEETLGTLASGNAYTDGSTTEYWSKYIKVGNQWYETSSPYGVAITTAANNVAYTAYVANDIYDIIECESTTYKTAGDITGTGYSSGKGVLLYSGSAMATTSKIAAGVYDFSVYNTVRRSNEDRLKLQYSTDGSSWTDVTTLTFPSSNAATQTAEKVVLAEDSYVRFLDDKGQNSCHYYDYILVKKFVSATLGTNGYATFASTYPLDLTTANLPEGVKAYKASVSGKTVTFTALDQTVPANTGILLEGTPSASVNIPVVASGTAVDGNEFEVNTTGATFTGDDDYYYFGLVKNTLKFGVFDPSTTAIPASKAYLKVLKTSVDAAARELNVVFEDEATGISAIPMNSEVMNNNYFDLQGRRVAQPTKGLYIVNGKKIIIK